MAYSGQSRDLEDRKERLQNKMYSTPNPYSVQGRAPGSRAAAIMFGAILAVLLLIALFSWTSGTDDGSLNGPTTGAIESQNAPASEPAQPAQ